MIDQIIAESTEEIVYTINPSMGGKPKVRA